MIGLYILIATQVAIFRMVIHYIMLQHNCKSFDIYKNKYYENVLKIRKVRGWSISKSADTIDAILFIIALLLAPLSFIACILTIILYYKDFINYFIAR